VAFIFEGEFDLGPVGLNFTIVVDQFVPAEGSIVGTKPAVLTTIVHLFGYAVLEKRCHVSVDFAAFDST
jgi:hypothetical protein